jgi:hypothetical protein
LVDVDTANTNTFIAVVFIEESEVVVALLEKLENGLGASSIWFVSVLSDGVFSFK